MCDNFFQLDEIQVYYWLIQVNTQVKYKTTDLATKCQRKNYLFQKARGLFVVGICEYHWKVVPKQFSASDILKTKTLCSYGVKPGILKRAGVGGRYQGTIKAILIILRAVDLRGFGEWGKGNKTAANRTHKTSNKKGRGGERTFGKSGKHPPLWTFFATALETVFLKLGLMIYWQVKCKFSGDPLTVYKATQYSSYLP